MHRTDGTRWGASFFTLQNIATLFAKNERTGEFGGGAYFACPDLVLVRRLDEASIVAAIAALVADGAFEDAFEPLE